MRNWLLLVVIVAVFGCGGGGGGESTPDNSQTSVTQSANGVWSGTLVDDINGTFTLDCLIHEGEIIAISEDAGRIYKGTYTVTGSSFTATVNAYDIGGGLADSGTMNGTVTEQDSLTATFQSEETTGSVSLTFDEIYNRSSSFSLTEGEWQEIDFDTWIDGVGFYKIDLTVDSEGTITGSDTYGCIANGVVSLLDTDHNLYGADVDITECGDLNGSYEGLAGLSDTFSENDTLTAVMSNDSYILFYSMRRQ